LELKNHANIFLGQPAEEKNPRLLSPPLLFVKPPPRHHPTMASSSSANIPSSAPVVTVHHLNDSRSQRILWLLCELSVPFHLERYQRDRVTRLAPKALLDVHPLGKSPVITDAATGKVIIESGAITEFVVRRYGGGRLSPSKPNDDCDVGGKYDQYVMWLHYAEGSAMTPLLMKLFMSRCGEGGAALQPYIDSQIDNHLRFIDSSLANKTWLLSDPRGDGSGGGGGGGGGDDDDEASFSAADIMLSFVAEAARLSPTDTKYPNLVAWLQRCQARPAYKQALKIGGHYAFAPAELQQSTL